MVELGPDGKHFIPPINANDQGGLYTGMTILKEQRHIMMDFGTSVTWVATIIPEAILLAAKMRKAVIDTWGEMPYNKWGLPLRVAANKEKGVIEIHMPQPLQVLVANPEVYLSLAEVIEDRIKETLQ